MNTPGAYNDADTVPGSGAPCRARFFIGILGALSLTSGVAGLLYEVVWVRLLGQVVGVDAIATQAVLSAFFLGMALGASCFSVWAHFQSPVLVYACLEFGLALCGVYSGYALHWADQFVPHLAASDAGPVLGFTAFFVAIVACLPSTLLMGATLPVLVWATAAGAPSPEKWPVIRSMSPSRSTSPTSSAA